MPKLLSAKQFPALVDVYFEVVTHDPVTGDIIRNWVFDDPMTFRCDYMSLAGHSEKYMKNLYDGADDMRVQVSPDDAEGINMGMRLGNLRNAHNPDEQYYRWVGARSATTPYYFNIRGMNPKVDTKGHIMYVEMTAKLAANA